MQTTLNSNTAFKFFGLLFLLLVSLISPVKSSSFSDETHLTKALKLEQKGMYEKAILVYDEAIMSFPQSAEIYFRRALAKIEIGTTGSAILDFSEAIKLSPSFGEAYNRRALAKWDLADYEGALFDNTKAIELMPNNKEAYYYRGLTYGRLNMQEESVSDFTKAIELDSSYTLAYLGSVCVILNMEQVSAQKLIEAETEVDRVIALDYSNPTAYKYKGLIAMHRGDNKSARKYLRYALRVGYKEMYGNDVANLLKTLKN